MALDYEKYAAEHDAIIGYYKPRARKFFLISLLLALVAFIVAFLALAFAFNAGSDNSNGKISLVLIVVLLILSSLVGRFKSKSNAAKRAMYNELDQLEFARKQASISN